MNRLLRNLWLAELILALLIIAGVADSTMAYISLFILVAGIWKLADLDALKLYIYSVPIFVALPPSGLSEAMSVWRFSLLFFLLKVLAEKFEVLPTLKDRKLTLALKRQALSARLGAFAQEMRTANYREILVPALVFVLVSLFSLGFAQSIGAGIKKLIFLGSVISLFGIVQWSVRDGKDARQVLRAVLSTGLGILTVGYVQLIATFALTLSDFWGLWDKHVISALYGERTMNLLSYSNTWFSYYGSDEIPATLRMFSVMQDSHSFSMLMIIFLPLALWGSRAARSRARRRACLAAYGLMMLALWFSGSRGAWVGILGAVAVAAYGYAYDRLPERLRLFGREKSLSGRGTYKTVLVALTVFALMFPISSAVLTANQDVQLIREGKMAGSEKFALLKRTWSISDMDETSNKGRLEIWRDSAASFARHPLTGIGLGNFPLALSEKVTTAKLGASAHNIYLDIAVETGIFGLLAFLVLLWRLGRRLFRLGRQLEGDGYALLAGGFCASFAWICVYGFFDVVVLNDKVFMLLVVVLALLYRLDPPPMARKG